MKTTGILVLALLDSVFRLLAATTALFDGKIFTGWAGDIGSVWRIEHGARLRLLFILQEEKVEFNMEGKRIMPFDWVIGSYYKTLLSCLMNYIT